MTWTYGGNPAANTRDQIRFKVGDTATADQLVSDEEIAYAVTESGSNVAKACALVCDAIAAKLARFVDLRDGGLAVSLSQRVAHYRDLASAFREQALGYAAPFAGAISVAYKSSMEEDSDRVTPAFETKAGAGPSDEMTEDWRGLK